MYHVHYGCINTLYPQSIIVLDTGFPKQFLPELKLTDLEPTESAKILFFLFLFRNYFCCILTVNVLLFLN